MGSGHSSTAVIVEDGQPPPVLPLPPGAVQADDGNSKDDLYDKINEMNKTHSDTLVEMDNLKAENETLKKANEIALSRIQKSLEAVKPLIGDFNKYVEQKFKIYLKANDNKYHVSHDDKALFITDEDRGEDDLFTVDVLGRLIPWNKRDYCAIVTGVGWDSYIALVSIQQITELYDKAVQESFKERADITDIDHDAKIDELTQALINDRRKSQTVSLTQFRFKDEMIGLQSSNKIMISVARFQLMDDVSKYIEAGGGRGYLTLIDKIENDKDLTTTAPDVFKFEIKTIEEKESFIPNGEGVKVLLLILLIIFVCIVVFRIYAGYIEKMKKQFEYNSSGGFSVW